MERKSDSSVIGITGPTASGKTLVSQYLEEHGYSVIDADKVSREVTEIGQPSLLDLAKVFGQDVLEPSGALNRRKLGDIAFASPERTELLNNTIFPHIRKAIRDEFSTLEKQGKQLIFLDAPTLFESGLDSECSAVVAVVADTAIRTQRLLAREPDLSQQQIETRIAAQPANDFYTARADYIIQNNDTAAQLENKVKKLLAQITRDLTIASPFEKRNHEA